MSFQMQAFRFAHLTCPECGEELLATRGQFADLYEHSQVRKDVYDSDLKQEKDRVNMAPSFSGFKGAEVRADEAVPRENHATYAQSIATPRCKNDGKYLVLKRTVVSATTL
jgi:hypothetical protein